MANPIPIRHPKGGHFDSLEWEDCIIVSSRRDGSEDFKIQGSSNPFNYGLTTGQAYPIPIPAKVGNFGSPVGQVRRTPPDWGKGSFGAHFPEKILSPEKETKAPEFYTCCGVDMHDLQGLLEHFEMVHTVGVDPASSQIIELITSSTTSSGRKASSATRPVTVDTNTPQPLSRRSSFPPAGGSQKGESGVSFDPHDLDLQLQNNPRHRPLHHSSSATPSQRYKCPNPNCDRSYKQATSLKYHMKHGSCHFQDFVKSLLVQKRREREARLARSGSLYAEGSTRLNAPARTEAVAVLTFGTTPVRIGTLASPTPQETPLNTGDEAEIIKQKPFACGVGDCQRRYKNLNGLKYHYNHCVHGAIGLELLDSGQHDCFRRIRSISSNPSRQNNRTGQPEKTVGGISLLLGRGRRNTTSSLPGGFAYKVKHPSWAEVSTRGEVGPVSKDNTVSQQGTVTPDFGSPAASGTMGRPCSPESIQSSQILVIQESQTPGAEGSHRFSDLHTSDNQLSSSLAEAARHSLRSSESGILSQPPAERLVNSSDDSSLLLQITSSSLETGEADLSTEAKESFHEQDIPPVDLTSFITWDNEVNAVSGGGFADVYQAILAQDDQQLKIAVKVIRRHIYAEEKKEKIFKRLRREIRVWGRLSHPNVLPFLGVTYKFQPYESMVCPWMEDGDLSKYLDKMKVTLTLSDRIKLLTDVAAGLSYLHSQSIIHGDLTSGNVLIHGGKACLSDFGLSKIIVDLQGISSLTSTVAGACRWAAPELYITEGDNDTVEVTQACDIYSFGGVVLQGISGKVPYYNFARDETVVVEKFRGNHAKRPSEPLLTDDIWEFILECWANPSLRPESYQLHGRLQILRHNSSGLSNIISLE